MRNHEHHSSGRLVICAWLTMLVLLPAPARADGLAMRVLRLLGVTASPGQMKSDAGPGGRVGFSWRIWHRARSGR